MKYYWIAAQIKENGKSYAYALRVSTSDNLLSKLIRESIVADKLCATKKQAAEIVTAWNEGYKANGSYMFADPAF